MLLQMVALRGKGYKRAAKAAAFFSPPALVLFAPQDAISLHDRLKCEHASTTHTCSHTDMFCASIKT